jgi:hypothetical protein
VTFTTVRRAYARYGFIFRRMIVSREEMRSSSALFPAPESGRYAQRLCAKAFF